MLNFAEEKSFNLFENEIMSWSDHNIPWNSIFDGQDIFKKNQNACGKSSSKYSSFNSDDFYPHSQKLIIDNDSLFSSNNEFEDHHLEQAIIEMANNGELGAFIAANTISLKEIQDDLGISYGKTFDNEPISKPRGRRHSICSSEELIKCPFPGCDKIFSRSYNFKSHLKTHSDEKPFKCNRCPLGFARCHDLKRHEKIHYKNHNESIKCDLCGKNFSRSDALNRHIKLNTCL